MLYSTMIGEAVMAIGFDRIRTDDVVLTSTDRVYAEVQEDDVILLVNEALGLRAVGPDLAAAARDFANEFAYSFQRFNSLDKEQLSPKAQAIKQLLNQLVDHGSH